MVDLVLATPARLVSRWCQIEMQTDMRERGWVNARYLTGSQGAATQLPEPPSGAAGEPMTVTGLRPGGTLNVRSGPGTSYVAIGSVNQGQTVQSIGCETVGGQRWCRILRPNGPQETGWVSARYLTRGVAVQQPSMPSASVGGTTTVRVRFPAGASGTRIAETLSAGATRRYLLGARSGQMLEFNLSSVGGDLRWRIITPSGSTLDEASTDRGYRGELFQNGDHVIAVTNRGSRAQSYQAAIEIR